MSASGDSVIAVVGPTAAGKSDLAVALAVRLGDAEIINADSMQLYRGMDIGTAKMPLAERRGVPHHLLDVLDVSATANVAQFQALARAAIADCHARGVQPVVVGGSALYVRAVLDPLAFPGTDAAVRERWRTALQEQGAEALHAELARRDPAAAAAILPTNGRRVVRALEVVELTGKPFVATMPPPVSIYPRVAALGVDIARDVLDERIARRVAHMWDAGLVEEVRALRARGLEDGLTASRALGYQQVLALLRGELDEDEAREVTIAGTRKFARRQDRLFHKDPRVQWLDWDAPDLVEQACARVRRTLQPGETT